MPNFDFAALRDARAKYGEAQKRLATVFAEAGAEMDMDKVKCVSGSREDKVAEIQRMDAELPDLKKVVDGLMEVARIAESTAKAEKSGERETGSDEGHTKRRGPWNIGDAIVDSQAFKKLPGSYEGPVTRLDVELKTLFARTGGLTGGGGAGWDPEDTRTGRLELIPQRPAVHVVDFIPQTTTGQSTVVYMEETTFASVQSDGSTPTVDGLAGEIFEADQFFEAQLALTEKTSEVRKVAIWLPFTDEQMEDEPRARGYINNRLTYMLQARLDAQVLTGSGTAPNLRGTENVAGINTQALGTDSIPDALYKGMRVIRDTGFAEPNVVFIRPAKWEAVRLLKTADGQYVWGHPSIPGVSTIWGVPVVETTVPTATKAIIGDYVNYSELAVRRGLDVQVTNAHSDYFIKGKQAIRMDLRCALLHYRPTAFTAVTGL